MYLKRLEIQGFKSFPDKIELEFNPGITSVVGPNGSGKSNIADAIRWVLGEQSVKTLRGTRMEDVIFAGTEHRKPLGFAEVSLTIDNGDALLPVAFSEVTVTRRVYRSGESEYHINKTPCRLKDIHELFFDTGLGKDGYSVIGQGRVDEILSTRSEDRRNIFEEASGIMKYKVRKLEAERKLEAAKQNLLRINDIICELENQLGPLKQQSETARKYLDLRENLKELEVNVFIDQIAKYKEKVTEFDEHYKSVKENIDAENTKLEDITRLNAQKAEYVKNLDERITLVRQEYYGIEGDLERCGSEIRVNEEKISGLEKNIARLDSEVSEIDMKIADIEKEEASKQEKLEYLRKRHEEYASLLEEYEKKLEAIIATLDESERHIEGLKATVMDKLDLLSDKKTQFNHVRTHKENLSRRQKSIEQEIYQLRLEKDRENMKREDLSESIYCVKEQISHVNKKLEAINLTKTSLESALADQRKRQNSLRSEFQFKSSRYKLLKEMEQNFEGYNRSVKAVLTACSQSDSFSRGIHGALAQLIQVEPRYETAIEMALGSALQNIVTDSEEDAKRAIDYLKKNKLGRATFLPIRSVKGKYLDTGLVNGVKTARGFCGVAADLVSCSSEIKGIILSLLGRVVVVDSLDSGIGMARKFSYSFRIATLEGDILNTTGSMTGGSAENRSSGILSRSRELGDLEKDIETLRTDEQILEREIQKCIDEINTKIREISALEKELKDCELIKMRDESQLSQLDENIKKSVAKMEMLQQEMEQLARQEAETDTEIVKYAAEQLQIEDDIANAKSTIAKYQEKNKESQSVRDSLHSDITDYKISVNSILESMESVEESLERLKGERESIIRSMSRRENEKNKCLEEIKKLKETNEGLAASIRKREEEKSGKTFEMDRITEEKKVLEEELYSLVNQINDVNKNILLLNEEFNRINIKKTKMESEMEGIQNRMWDEYELTYTNALPLKKDIGSVAQAQKRINEIRSCIRELGPVNVASIDEYVKTKERYEFMGAQRDDMESAKDKLHRVIYEMTSIMKKQFLEQFKLINSNFNIVFKELFDGGRAELTLTDEENVLESGIEIEVQPPGKRLQNMMLLSGGERALTAIALLFAILRLRPTPFCILDEIEAALDDANVFRFSQYLRRYSSLTQFIMVTHRKGTMEGSDMLYGVTMQEHGISKIVSMKMGEKVG